MSGKKEDEMIPLRSPSLNEDDLVVETITDKDFCMNDSPWEKIFHAHTKAPMRALREHLLNILQTRRIPPRRYAWYVHRWRKCLFDSISDTYFLMTEIFVPTGVTADLMAPFLKKEESGISEIGRKDVTYLDLMRMKWGRSGNTHLIREKLNGVHVELYIAGKYRAWVMLGFFFEIKDSPTELLEWTSDGMYGLYPYGVPDHKVGNILVTDHRWHAPSMSVVQHAEEGVMLLQGTTEVRMKRIPTIEADYCGEIWECGLDDVGLFKIRPRYGKYPSQPEVLNCYPTLDDLDVPHASFVVNYTLTGPFSGRFRFDDQLFTIDSGYRMNQGVPKHIEAGIPVTDVQDILLVERVYHYIRDGKHNSGPAIEERPAKSGAKAIIFNEMGESFLIKDEDKPLDYVGGTITYGESSQDCLIREIWEETGSKVLPEDMVFLGVSTGRDTDTNWHTFLYLIPSMKLNMKKFTVERDSAEWPQIVQPWVSRIKKFIVDSIGNCYREFFLAHSVVHVDQPTVRQQQVIKTVIRDVIGTKSFFTGADLMHAIHSCSHVQEIDFSVLRMVLCGDIRVTPFINVMCDHDKQDTTCECAYVIYCLNERNVLRAKTLHDALFNWITHISSHFCLSNGVVKKLDSPSSNITVARWVKPNPTYAKMTKDNRKGVCCLCGYVRTGHWFLYADNAGTLCPRCYVKTTLKKEVKKKPG
jgi:ADP-ribose pyrophosphatase YjhB (NUDIX family)